MNNLSEEIHIRVRFSEVDALRMVWHGSYVTYLEDAREAFGRKYGLEYLTIFNHGYFAPMYDLHIKYRKMATLDDDIVVRITYVPKNGGRLCFDYEIRNAKTDETVLIASSVQLFTTTEGVFDPMPAWFEEWKNTHL